MKVGNKDYRERLTHTIISAYRKMLEKKARLSEMVHTDDGIGVMRNKWAIDVYRPIYGELPKYT